MTACVFVNKEATGKKYLGMLAISVGTRLEKVLHLKGKIGGMSVCCSVLALLSVPHHSLVCYFFEEYSIGSQFNKTE